MVADVVNNGVHVNLVHVVNGQVNELIVRKEAIYPTIRIS